MSPPRERATHGAPGDATRTNLVAVALRLFGERGFDGVSTRELALAADANVAAISYHFGGKEGLYKAVAEAFVNEKGEGLRRLAARLREEASGLVGNGPAVRRAAAALAGRLVSGMVQGILGQPDAHHVISFVVREQLQPTAAFDVIFEGVIRPVHETLTALVAQATNRAPDDPDTILHAHALIGSGLSFGFARAAALRRLGWKQFGPDELERVAQVVALVAEQACGVEQAGSPRRGRRRR